ncbi:MAG: hypothetical protein H6566_05615 [Lewinellaceae bacterium]|nr:hypothetical protein [Lewinellaceae bacterium]
METFYQIEQFLLTQLDETERDFSLKALNEAAEAAGCAGVSPQRLKTILNFWYKTLDKTRAPRFCEPDYLSASQGFAPEFA